MSNNYDYNSREIERVRKRSTSGSSAKRNNEYIKIKYSNYKRSLKVLATGVAITVGLITGAAPKVMDAAADNMTINSMTTAFHSDVINHETHRTADREHYFYDYSDIAQAIKAMDNFDEGVLFLDLDIGDAQTDKVMYYTEYESFDNYLKSKGYGDSKEFREDMKKQVILSESIEMKQQELEEMQKEHMAQNLTLEAQNSFNQGGK